MKINKKKLLEIIEDELRKDAVREEEEFEEVDIEAEEEMPASRTEMTAEAMSAIIVKLVTDHPEAEDILVQALQQVLGDDAEGEPVFIDPEIPGTPGIARKTIGFRESIEEMVRELLAEEGEKNPWKICTKKVGREDKKKYEDCVLSVKGEK